MNALKELEETGIDFSKISFARLINENDCFIFHNGNISQLKEWLSHIEDTDQLKGIILMDDESWYERYDYDTSLYWLRLKRPTIDEIMGSDLEPLS